MFRGQSLIQQEKRTRIPACGQRRKNRRSLTQGSLMVCADQQGTGQFGWAQICRAMSQSVEFPQQASIAPVNDAQSQRKGNDRTAAARAPCTGRTSGGERGCE